MLYYVKNIRKNDTNRIIGDVYSTASVELFDNSENVGENSIYFNQEASNWYFYKTPTETIQLYQLESQCLFLCDECGELYKKGDGKRISKKHYCMKCLVYCKICNSYELKENVTEHKGTFYCKSCYNKYFTACTRCGKMCFKSEEMIQESRRGNYYCIDCATIELSECHNCHGQYENSYFTENEETIEEFGNVCLDCESRLVEQIIKGYHERPELEFFGEGKKFFGLELEISGAGEDNKKAQAIKKTIGKKHVYFNHDGSIRNGFEIITQPHSYDEIMKIDWEDVGVLLKGYGYYDNAETCGTHVHVSKEAFGKNNTERDLNYSKILFFFEKYWTKILKFSRRNESEVERWASRYGMDMPLKILEKAKNSPRYRCVNLINDKTIEFRIFKGTIDASEVRAIIEFCHLLTDNVKSIPVEKLPITKFSGFLKGMSTNLREKLVSRGCLPKPTEIQELSFDELFLNKDCNVALENGCVVARLNDLNSILTQEEFELSFGEETLFKILFKEFDKERVDRVTSFKTLTIRADIKEVNNYYTVGRTDLGTNRLINLYSGKSIQVNLVKKEFSFFDGKPIFVFETPEFPYLLTELMFEELYKQVS